MKQKVVLSIMIITVVGLLIGVGTYAYFTASDTNGDNTFTAARLSIDVQRDDGEPTPGPLFYFDNETDGAALQPNGTLLPGTKEDGYWWPGKVSEIKVLDVHNTGNIAAKLDWIDAVVEDPTPGNGVDDTVLANALWIKVMTPSQQLRWQGYLSELTDATPGTLAPNFNIAIGSKQTILVQASMPTDPPGEDNSYQGKNVKVQFRVHATQQ